MFFLRTLFTLCRASSLPTVWSNCLAGWWLGQDGTVKQLPFLFAGATFLYLGGAFLNDAFDAGYDRQHRRVRPIPSGAITARAVWRWGWVWLVLGAASLFWLGKVTGGLGLALIVCILSHNALHRLITFSPVVLGACRFFLYLTGAATGADGLTGWSIWCGLALGTYVIGLGYLARQARPHEPARRWPALLLSIPIALALLMNADGYRQGALLLSAVLGLWSLRCLRHTFWSDERNVSATVSGLLAGIVFVDWLAAADGPRGLSLAFLALFLTTLALQRLLPEKSGNGT